MAAEVPVSDVLCQATEYLIKLGSNLRSRSENLKENKIRKDKLKNSHAIQKAAQKVLLICDLSKKSLDNVEIGVRKILSHIKANQYTNDGGKSSLVQTKDNRFQYFEFDNCKLKVSKKINIKYFLSAKVSVEPMLRSTMDKYPVYHNCKLYMSRKRMEYENKNEHKNTTEINNETSNTTNLEIEDSVEKIKLKSPAVIKVTPEDTAVTLINSDHEIDDTNTSQIKNKTQDTKKIKSKRDSSEGHTLQNKTENKKEIIENNLDMEKSDIKFDDNIQQNSTSEKGSKDRKERDERYGKSKRDSEKKKYTNIRSLNSSDSEAEQNPKQIEKKDCQEKIESIEKHDVEEIKDNTAVDTQSNEQPIKPLIKCVSMTKLLKPEILQSVVTEIQSKISPSKKLSKSEKAKRHKGSGYKENDVNMCKKQKLEEEEYWKAKRKEVKAFKPKTFIIKVARLPQFSMKFLETCNIKRITQKGVLILELKDKSEKFTDIETLKKLKSDLLNDSDSENTDISPEKEVIHAKHALLDESDSDQDKSCCNLKTKYQSRDSNKNTKKTDVNKQGERECRTLEESNNHEVGENVNSNPLCGENIPQKTSTEENDSNDSLKECHDDSIKHKNDRSEQTHTKTTGSSKCSSDDSDSSSKKSKSKQKNGNKRKYAIESMHAKSMLMKHSSSSDTDDEQLRNTRKNKIKRKNSKLEINKVRKKQRRISDTSSSSSVQDKNLKDNSQSRSKSPENDKKIKKSEDEEKNKNSENGSSEESDKEKDKRNMKPSDNESSEECDKEKNTNNKKVSTNRSSEESDKEEGEKNKRDSINKKNKETKKFSKNRSSEESDNVSNAEEFSNTSSSKVRS